MSNKSIGLEDDLHAYLLSVGVREPELLRQLREEALAHPQGQMQIAPEEGAFLAMLVRLTGARRVLEVGTFTGYSSTSMALALPPDGRIVCCDVSEEFTNRARQAWTDAGVSDRVDLRLGPGVETLDALLAAGEAGSFDLAFIDADKENYANYYERSLQLMRRGGVIALDNVLWSGRVADSSVDDASTNAIRAINTQIAADERVDIVMVPIADGVTVARIR